MEKGPEAEEESAGDGLTSNHPASFQTNHTGDRRPRLMASDSPVLQELEHTRVEGHDAQP